MLSYKPVSLDPGQRRAVERAIDETCRIRCWDLHAVNVRTNHVHVVLTAATQADAVLGVLKANATRGLREERLWRFSHSPWSHGGSTRYLWKTQAVVRTIEYVNNQDHN